MAREFKELQAPLESGWPTESDRPLTPYHENGGVVRLWASNVPTRDPYGYRCISFAYVIHGVDCVEPGNPVTPLVAMSSRHHRKAC